MTHPRHQLLSDLLDYVWYLKESGVRELEVSNVLPPAPPPKASTSAGEQLAAVAGQIAACRKCALCEERTNTVPGQGHPQPEILFVGEGPGNDEDRQGLAFVGEAGRLLTRMIESGMGLKREEVFIANVVKCHPPGNRTPNPDEMEACMPYLEAQIDILRPKVIVALGATALKGLLGEERLSITRMRGTWLSFRGIDLMPTFHPAYLLRQKSAKKDAWNDLKAVLKKLGKTPPAH